MDPIEVGSHGLNEALASLSRRDAAGTARQEPHAQARLKRTDGSAKSGLRHADLRGGAGEVPLSRYRQEGDQVRNCFPSHSCVKVIGPSRI